MNGIELPRGCSLRKYSLVEAFTTRLFFPKRINRKIWESEYEPSENLVRRAYESIIRYAIIQGDKHPEYHEPLSEIDDETGLAYRVLLSQGINLLGRGHFILTTSNRLGMDATNKNAAFALGEKMHFRGTMNLRWETRQVEGDMIGVVLNLGLRAARLKPGQTTTISADQVYSLFDSVIAARKAFLKEEEQGNISKFFTQEEFDKATNWVIFGDSKIGSNRL